MRRHDALARHERAQHADSQIKVFNLGIVLIGDSYYAMIGEAANLWTDLAMRACFKALEVVSYIKYV